MQMREDGLFKRSNIDLTLEYTITYTITDTDGVSATFSHKLSFDAI